MKNKFEVTTTIGCSGYDPVYDNVDVDIDEITKLRLATKLANEIAKTYPTEVIRGVTNIYGIPEEVHKMTLFIFSEQQLNEYTAELKRMFRYDLAAMEALNSISKNALCN